LIEDNIFNFLFTNSQGSLIVHHIPPHSVFVAMYCENSISYKYVAVNV
jgi:hypothetical protein